MKDLFKKPPPPPIFFFIYNQYCTGSLGVAAAPPTSSPEAILHCVFRPLARYTLRTGGPQL